jgi:hypothetical protein
MKSTNKLSKEKPGLKGGPSASGKLLSCDHESRVRVLEMSLVKMQGKTAYIRHKVSKPFPGTCASGSYRAALLKKCLDPFFPMDQLTIAVAT